METGTGYDLIHWPKRVVPPIGTPCWVLLFRYKGEIWDGGTYGELDQLESAHYGMTFVFDRTPGFKYLMHYNELAETGELERAVVETAVGASRASTETSAVWEIAKPSITD